VWLQRVWVQHVRVCNVSESGMCEWASCVYAQHVHIHTLRIYTRCKLTHTATRCRYTRCTHARTHCSHIRSLHVHEHATCVRAACVHGHPSYVYAQRVHIHTRCIHTVSHTLQAHTRTQVELGHCYHRNTTTTQHLQSTIQMRFSIYITRDSVIAKCRCRNSQRPIPPLLCVCLQAVIDSNQAYAVCRSAPVADATLGFPVPRAIVFLQQQNLFEIVRVHVGVTKFNGDVGDTGFGVQLGFPLHSYIQNIKNPIFGQYFFLAGPAPYPQSLADGLLKVSKKNKSIHHDQKR
jgi:hypothetical protein